MQSIILFIHRKILFALGALSFLTICFAQQSIIHPTGPVHTVSFEIQPKDSVFNLSHQFILARSETVLLDTHNLVSGKDYLLDNRFGVLKLNRESVLLLISDTSVIHRLEVTYKALPLTFRPKYFHREPVIFSDSVSGKATQTVKPVTPFTFDDVFGSNLQKSGSIVRGFTIGSNRDLSLNSGFRMQMSGNITDDLEITAALTDENSPIQPEGTTQTLQEFDKVFVELRGSNISGTFGDYMLNFEGSEFARINRKLQGAKGAAQYRTGETSGDLVLTGAVTRGKYSTNQFQGFDGVQGPYRLSGKNNERDIIVIAGTERVYLNGEQMARGENNDYVIDYGNGELTFTTRRLISHTSRIIVDFEYSDRQFNRSLIGTKTNIGFMDNKLMFHATALKESDDQDSPIDINISDVDKDTLRAAGDDQLKASRNGAVLVGPGSGQYIKSDTTVVDPSTNQPTLLSIYTFAPYDTLNAVYSVTFSFVGSGKGDYSKISVGHYRFAGISQGAYAPIRFLPLPQSQSLIDFGITGQFSDDLKITGEYAASSFDANRFSAVQDDDNNGSAVKFGLQYSPKNIQVGSTNIGSMNLTLSERYVQQKFVPLDRFNEVEFNRKWNIADSSNLDEEIREGAISYKPITALTVEGGIGRIERGDVFSSNRYTSGIGLNQTGLPDILYRLEAIRTRDGNLNSDGSWTRHRGSARQKFGNVSPSLEYHSEILRSRNIQQDTLTQGSFRFNEVIPSITVDSIANMTVKAGVGLRWDDSLSAGSLQSVSRTITQSYGLQFYEWNNFSSMLDMTIQNRKFTELFKQRNGDDREALLLRWRTRFNPFNRGVETDWFYEAASEQAAKLERVFQRVQRGTGNYIYAGDVNANNIVDEQDFQLTRFDGDFIAVTVPTDALTPVVDVKASVRVRLSPYRFISDSGWIGSVLSAVSTETYLRVEERSSEPETEHIYLLHFSRFLNNETTLSGSNVVTQDVHILENNPGFSLRFRFNQRHGVAQFATLNEGTYGRERSVRLRWQFLEEIANQIDVIEKADNLAATQFSTRMRNVYATTIVSDWSYRPIQDVEVGFRIDLGQATNYDTTKADINAQAVRCIYSIQGRGQIKGEFTREEVVLNKPFSILPFELTNGKGRGKTWLWRLGLDYRLTQFIQGSLSYDGRSEGGGSTVHTAKAEVRAFF